MKAYDRLLKIIQGSWHHWSTRDNYSISIFYKLDEVGNNVNIGIKGFTT